MDFNEIANNVNNKVDFLKFMDALIENYKNESDDWENKTIEDYLEALRSCFEDMDGFYSYRNIELPNKIPWFIFSNALMSARIYE